MAKQRDKKYWSSSRGKDRYPYPVGYAAVQAHNESTYKTEIHEGPKGPLFSVSSANGHSSFGQTTDIAWEKFQKIYCPSMKILHGKRFSCNIDGIELLQGPDVEDFTFPMALEVKDGDHTSLGNYQATKDLELSVPDTLDLELDNDPSIQDKSRYRSKEELTEADMIISESLVSEACPEEVIGPSNSNGSSPKSDFDSVGQDTAKFFMSFLLPQAILLLKKIPRKNKAAASPPMENMPFGENTLKQNKETNVSTPAVLVTEAKMMVMNEQLNIQSTNLGSADVENIVTLENSVVCICGEHASHHEMLPYFYAKADQVGFKDEKYPCNAHGQSIGIGEHNESLDCFLEANESKCIFCYDEVPMDSSGIRDACYSAAGGADVNLQGMLRSDISPEKYSVRNVVEVCGKPFFTEVPRLVYSRRNAKTINPMKGKYSGPLSESIICRNFGDNYVSEACPTRNSIASETVEKGTSDEKIHTKDLYHVEPKFLGQPLSLHANKTMTNSKGLPNSTVSVVSEDQSFICASNNKEATCFLHPSGSYVQKSHIHVDKEVVGHENLFRPSDFESTQKHRTSISNSSSSITKEFQCLSDVKPKSTVMNKDLLGIGELVACYLHPLPVLSLMIALERSGLQFTPGGRYLVLLDSIRTPYCREGRIPCLCPACASSGFEEDAVKIIEVNLGYVSVVVKLKTVESLQSVLVCEPNHLVGVGESGRLHLWVMDSAWSSQTEKIILPANDLVFPGIVELKKIPKCACLVVGHNGFGEFCLWDISKRILVSRFSAPCTSYLLLFPVSLFGWKKTGHGFTDCDVHEHVNRKMAATNVSFSQKTSDDSFPPLEEDIAVLLLVSVAYDSDANHDYISGDYQTNSAGWWRLALLVKNMVILGSALDPSAAAIGASAGHRIIGPCDGLVYMWEMSTGTKLGTLHHFRDNNAYNDSSIQDKSTYRSMEETTAADIIVSEGLVSESCPEEVIGTSNSNGSSRKSDFDSVCQETANFFMSVLLKKKKNQNMASKKLSLSSFSSFLFFFHLTLLLSLSVVSSSEFNNNLPPGSSSNYSIDGRDWIDLHRRELSVSNKNFLEGSFVLNFTNQLSVVDTVTSYSTAMRNSSAVWLPRGGKSSARHLSSLRQGYRREYDYFLFTQQWPGGYQFRCEPTYEIDIRDFKIHGLWPQYYRGGSPKNCDGHDYFKESEVVGLIHYLEQAWPDIVCPSDNGRSFWAYQWRRHGTCSNHVFDQYSYFHAALQLKYNLDLLSILENQGIVPDDHTYYSLNRINRAIASWTGHYPARTRCETNTLTFESNLLMEIGVCVNYRADQFFWCTSHYSTTCEDRVIFAKWR